MLKNAKAIAGNDGKLIVGILTDEAVMEKKPKPILSFEERIELARSIKYVDVAVAQETYSPLPNVKKICPDILMESTSHDNEAIEEAKEVMENLNGKVIPLPYFPSQSSKDIKQIILSNNNSINVVIAAAGRNPSIINNNCEIPKALLDIKGQSILERQVKALRRLRVKNIYVVRGFKKEMFENLGVEYIDNDEFDDKGIFYSFMLAMQRLKRKTILIYGDTIFQEELVRKLIKTDSDFVVMVDRSWRERYKERSEHPMSRAELVEEQNGVVTKIGHGISYDSAFGEFVGMCAISAVGVETLKSNGWLPNTIDSNCTEDFSKFSLVEFFQLLVLQGIQVHTIETRGGWHEIDTFEDYRKSWILVD